MTGTSGASEHETHEATYGAIDPRSSPGRFECQVTCSCGDFERTSTSRVSAAQARSNARTTFTRHSRDKRVALEATERAAVESVRLAAARSARDDAEQAARLERLRVAEAEVLEEAARVDREEAAESERAAEALTARPDPTSDPEPDAEPEPQAEPVAASVAPEGTGRLRISPAFATAFRRWLVPALVVVAVIAAIAIVGARGADAPEPGAGGDIGDTSSTAPDLPTESAVAPSVAPPTSPREFVDGLRTLDPVFDGYSDPTLVRAGESICTFYESGQDVVQIIASIGSRGALAPQQSALVVRLASPVFCPRFTKPMTEELDGLG